jgi:hypothetical protein
VEDIDFIYGFILLSPSKNTFALDPFASIAFGGKPSVSAIYFICYNSFYPGNTGTPV